MHNVLFEGQKPKFYGSTTIGERGQMVVPAEARKDLDLPHSTKVMVFQVGPEGQGLLILKADTVATMISNASQMLDGVKSLLNTDTTDEEDKSKDKGESHS